MSFSQRLLSAMKKRPPGRWISPLQSIVDDELSIFKAPVSREVRNSIPDTKDIPLDNPSKWIEIPNVICCFVDMLGSTKLSVGAHPSTTAKFYRLFTSTAIRMFHELDAPYIDVKGDGVFALFDERHSHRALAATVSFKTFVDNEFVPLAKEKELSVDGHYGIDKKSVLVRRMGKRFIDGRTDRQNEVWAGKPVNMASKLAGLTKGGEIIVSDRFHSGLTDDGALESCGCPNGNRFNLWDPISLEGNPLFDFDTAYRMKTGWCSTHGIQFCSHLLEVDETQ